MTLIEGTFENIVGKEENACNWHFLLQQECHVPLQTKIEFWFAIILSSASTVNLDESKMFLFGKGLTNYHTIPTFDDPEKETFWKSWGKRRKCW